MKKLPSTTFKFKENRVQYEFNTSQTERLEGLIYLIRQDFIECSTKAAKKLIENSTKVTN